MIIAVDGPAGAGKGIIAASLASTYALKYLDTGLLYRSVALRALGAGINLTEQQALVQLALSLDLDDLKDPALRYESTASMASQIAVLPEIREILTRHMRLFSHCVTLPYQGVILDGRDIGTVVCPEANVKLFITASPEIRAARRAQEMKPLGNQALENQEGFVLAQVQERDARDVGRSIAPLIPAYNAHIIDTSTLSIEESCAKANQIVQEVLREI